MPAPRAAGGSPGCALWFLWYLCIQLVTAMRCARAPAATARPGRGDSPTGGIPSVLVASGEVQRHLHRLLLHCPPIGDLLLLTARHRKNSPLRRC